MKFKKLLAAMLVAGGLLATQQAQAWSTSVVIDNGVGGGWSNADVTDGDGDVTFSFNGTDLPNSTVITFTENESGGIDNYTVAISAPGGGALTGTYLSYGITVNDGNSFTSKSLDSSVSNGADTGVTSTVGIDQTLTQTSTNGSHVENLFAGTALALSISDTFTINSGSLFQVTDGYAAPSPPVQTPEPVSLALFGIGAAGMAAARRRRSV